MFSQPFTDAGIGAAALKDSRKVRKRKNGSEEKDRTDWEVFAGLWKKKMGVRGVFYGGFCRV